jgi:hypothetical protein
MKKLFFKMGIYTTLILIILELIVRVFHLTKDYPERYVDAFGVEKWMPNQSGYSVTGNRRQNFSKFNINNSGYNSYREFSPSKDKIEMALVGDSFIEGFHQNYYNSIGKKIENELDGIEVYEYGYAGYDLADELHLINQYKSQFDLIDYVIVGLDFDNDLSRGEYHIVQDRIKLESGTFKAMRQIKLLVYLQTIGAFDTSRELVRKILSNDSNHDAQLTPLQEKKIKEEFISKRFDNFKNLVTTYGYDTSRFILLLDAEKTPSSFIKYLEDHHYKYIDFSKALKESLVPVSLIYDQHWNNLGRNIISNVISEYIKKKMTLIK